MYEVEFNKQAIKDLKRIPKNYNNGINSHTYVLIRRFVTTVMRCFHFPARRWWRPSQQAVVVTFGTIYFLC